MVIYAALALSVFLGALGAYLNERKGYPHWLGFLMGFFFGLLGILALLFSQRKKSLAFSCSFNACHKGQCKATDNSNQAEE